MQSTTDTKAPAPEQILTALQDILQTDKFLCAPQMSAFLKYVVEQAVKGNESRIKAYTVAVDALGKPPTFDPQNDPVVRVLAGRLRTSLASYHDTRENLSVVIQMKPGSYVPRFSLAGKTETPSAEANLARLPTTNRQQEISGTSKRSNDHENLEQAINTGDQVVSNATFSSIPKAANHQWTDSSSSSDRNAAQARVVADPSESDNKTDSSADHGQHYRAKTGLTDLLSFFTTNAKASVVAGLLAVGMFILYIKETDPTPINTFQPSMLLGSSPGKTSETVFLQRERPDKVTLFVSAMEPLGSLENQLNTMISGVFSESPDINVYRILASNQTPQYWPEDYLVSLDIVPLPEQTRVSIQLIEGQTGRVSHTQTLALSSTAKERFSHDELSRIMLAAHELLAIDGPLIRDYRAKEK